MGSEIIENYVAFSEKISFGAFFPYGLIIGLIGLTVGMPYAVGFLREIIAKITRPKVSKALAIAKSIWAGEDRLALYGAALSTVLAVLTLISFMQGGEELELSLRCEPTEEYVADNPYVYASVRCAVKNSGNITATIDTIEPVFYWSEAPNLARTSANRSYHVFRGDPSELVGKEFQLPQVLQRGVTKVFHAKVAIPIGWWVEESTDKGRVLTTPDVDVLLNKFSSCIEKEQVESCFQDMTGKTIRNYIYETIEYPGGMGGYQPINGVGLAVSDFDYTAEVEVDFVTGRPYRPKENVDVLSGHFFSEDLENIRRPWWSKMYTIWREDGSGGASGISSNFVLATGVYLLFLVSVLGWYVLCTRAYQAVFHRRD